MALFNFMKKIGVVPQEFQDPRNLQPYAPPEQTAPPIAPSPVAPPQPQIQPPQPQVSPFSRMFRPTVQSYGMMPQQQDFMGRLQGQEMSPMRQTLGRFSERMRRGWMG